MLKWQKLPCTGSNCDFSPVWSLVDCFIKLKTQFNDSCIFASVTPIEEIKYKKNRVILDCVSINRNLFYIVSTAIKLINGWSQADFLIEISVNSNIFFIFIIYAIFIDEKTNKNALKKGVRALRGYFGPL